MSLSIMLTRPLTRNCLQNIVHKENSITCEGFRNRYFSNFCGFDSFESPTWNMKKSPTLPYLYFWKLVQWMGQNFHLKREMPCYSIFIILNYEKYNDVIYS